MNNDFEKAYEMFFNKKNENKNINDGVSNDIIKENNKPSSSRNRLSANGNINDLIQFGEILNKLLNITLGSNWGILRSDTVYGDEPHEITMPQINYTTNLREVSKGTSPKPTLMDTIAEEVDGVKTGDSFRIYRQTFDCIIEFNFVCQTSKDCNELMNKFERIIVNYAGYLKENGVKEIFFLKEVPSKYSFSNSSFKNSNNTMKTLFYFVKIERNISTRVSEINEIETKLKIINNTNHRE